MGGIFPVVAWIGALVLLAIIIWAWAQNRSAKNIGQAERGARELREELNREDTGQKPRE